MHARLLREAPPGCKIPLMGDLTQLFAAVRGGDRQALDQVFEITYHELRTLARQRLRKAAPDGVLNTTSLVHECYLRLTHVGRLSLDDRSHFLGYAARVMRSVVVDFARERLSQRRGAGAMFVTVGTDIPDHEASGAEDVLRIEEALQELAQAEQRLVQVVEMRYFAGLSIEEIADSLGIAVRTVRRDWDKARLLLSVALRR
jgi:RNA polymerase sigma factor (TIGR02999 family)